MMSFAWHNGNRDLPLNLRAYILLLMLMMYPANENTRIPWLYVHVQRNSVLCGITVGSLLDPSSEMYHVSEHE